MGKTESSTNQLKPVNGFLFEPEMVFLRDCLRACLFPGETQLNPPVNLDWLRFHDLLIEDHLVGLFHKFGEAHPGLWPEHLARQLRDERYRLILDGDWYENQAKIVLMALQEENIPAILLKGWALVQILYGGQYSQRSSNDMDLMVKPGDLNKVDRILLSLGFKEGMVEPWPGYAQRYLNSRHYGYLSPIGESKTRHVFNIDMHWGIPEPPYFKRGTDMQPFFERARPIKIQGIETTRLAMEDHLIYACSHIAHHGYVPSISAYYEIAAVVLREGQRMDWAAVLARARTLGMVIPLTRVLCRIEALWPGVIAHEIMESFVEQKPTGVERWIDGWLVKSKGREKMIGMLAWFTTPGLFRKSGYVLETVIPSPYYLEKVFGPAPLGFKPLLYTRHVAAVLLNRFG